MIIIACSKKGKTKLYNEDRMMVNYTILEDGQLICDVLNGIVAVADGVGGNAGGAKASQFICSGLGEINEVTEERLRTLDHELIEKSRELGESSRMATTLAGLQIKGKNVRLFYVGNSRIYILKQGKYLYQLSDDDTTVNCLVKQGKMTEEAARTAKNRSELLACMGGGTMNFFKIVIKDMIVNPGIVFLLTTDGIHDYLDVDAMEEIIDENGFSAKTCSRLVEAAERHCSMDDKTAVLVRI